MLRIFKAFGNPLTISILELLGVNPGGSVMFRVLLFRVMGGGGGGAFRTLCGYFMKRGGIEMTFFKLLNPLSHDHVFFFLFFVFNLLVSGQGRQLGNDPSSQSSENTISVIGSSTGMVTSSDLLAGYP